MTTDGRRTVAKISREENNETLQRGGNGREIETAMVEVNGEAIEERLQYCRSNIFLGETDR